MRFNLGEVWKSVEAGDSKPRRAVVIATEDDRRRGTLFFNDGDEQSFLWAELTQTGNWQVDTSPKPTRSADVLKEIILRKIQRHPVCPAGMSVEVRQTSGHDWEALPVPPPGQHIAYADCANYISTVASALRSLDGVRLFPVESTLSFPMSWMNSGDDTGDVARTMAERQRRSLAAIHSGTTDPITPGVQEPSASTPPSTIELTARSTIQSKTSLDLSVDRASQGESPSAIPDQSPAPVRVEDRNGIISRISDRDSPLEVTEQDFNDWREPVLDHIQELLSGDFRLGTNHSRARDRLLALSTLFTGIIPDVKEKQFHIGYQIERLQGLVVAYRSGADDMPGLDAAALEDLDRLRIALVMGIGKLERWSEFHRAATADPLREGSANPGVVGAAIDEIVAEMEAQPKYFDPELPKTFRFLAEAMKDPAGATKTVIFGAVKSIENLVIFLGQRALGIGGNALGAIEQHISKAVAVALIASLSDAALKISGGLPTAWTWLRPLLDLLPRGGGG